MVSIYWDFFLYFPGPPPPPGFFGGGTTCPGNKIGIPSAGGRAGTGTIGSAVSVAAAGGGGVGADTMIGGGSTAPILRITICCRRRRRAVGFPGFITRGLAIAAASSAPSEADSPAAGFRK